MTEEKRTSREERENQEARQRREDNNALDPRINPWLEELDEVGYITIPDFINAGELAQIRRAFDTEVPLLPLPINAEGDGKTVRGHNLLAKTRAADFLFLHPMLRALVEGHIGDQVRVNITTLFNLLPGEKKQPLHQDDGLWPIPRPHPKFLCNALVAIDDFDLENGATHLVPYSHTWHDRKVDQETETVQVTMKAGSMVMWSGAMWHAGGANVTGNRERLGLFISHVVSYLAPQETQLISIPRGVVREMPRKLQRLVGYQKFSGIGGEVDFRDPIDVLEDSQVVHPQAKIGSSGFGRL